METKETKRKVEDPAALEQMKKLAAEDNDTRWAAYENSELGNPMLGHLKFLAVGPNRTVKEAPKARLPDMQGQINWRYLFVGYVDLETGVVDSNGE